MSFSAFAYVTGDKIEFQSESTFVSGLYNKSICHDGENYYATFRVCGQLSDDDDGAACEAWETVSAVQPMTSTRQRCAELASDSSSSYCERFETVEYFQSPVRTVKFFNPNSDSNRPYKTETVVIPNCQ